MRSAYSADMRFFPDQPERLVGVTWYRVPDDRPFLPYPHAFASRVWDYQKNDDPPYGEMNLPRPWRGGQTPATAGDGGVCGTPDEWLNGCKPDAEIPPPWAGSDVCGKCAPPSLLFMGGTGTGGLLQADRGCCSTLPPPPDLYAQYVGPATYPDMPPGTVIHLTGDWLPGPAPPRDDATWSSAPFAWGGMDLMLFLSCEPTLGDPPKTLFLLASDLLTLFIGSDQFPPLSCDPFTVEFALSLQPPVPPLAQYCYWRVTETPP